MVTVEVGHSVTPVTVGGCASHHPGYCGRLGKPITLVTMAGGALHHPGYSVMQDIPSSWSQSEVGHSITKVTEWNRTSITLVTVVCRASICLITVAGRASHHPGYIGK